MGLGSLSSQTRPVARVTYMARFDPSGIGMCKVPELSFFTPAGPGYVMCLGQGFRSPISIVGPRLIGRNALRAKHSVIPGL